MSFHTECEYRDRATAEASHGATRRGIVSVAPLGRRSHETTLLDLMTTVTQEVGDDAQAVRIVTACMERGWIRRRDPLMSAVEIRDFGSGGGTRGTRDIGGGTRGTRNIGACRTRDQRAQGSWSE